MTRYEAGEHTPLHHEELGLVRRMLDALDGQPRHGGLVQTIVDQCQNLEDLGALLARYPSPLEDQRLGERRRGLDTLVETLCETDRAAFALRAPTQAVVGRALTHAQINFFRLLWHVCGDIGDPAAAARLREEAARHLRNCVYTKLVEEVLSDLSIDSGLGHEVRSRAVHSLAQLWGHRLTWRVNEFFPVLESTWEARARTRVVGGNLLGASELVQLLTAGGDHRFVELLTAHEPDHEETLAFREFLFGRSSEELDQLTRRMAAENLTSIALDSQVTDVARDAGSVFFEFFQARFQLALARQISGQPGPKRTAEGYVLLAWLEQAAE